MKLREHRSHLSGVTGVDPDLIGDTSPILVPVVLDVLDTTPSDVQLTWAAAVAVRRYWRDSPIPLCCISIDDVWAVRARSAEFLPLQWGNMPVEDFRGFTCELCKTTVYVRTPGGLREEAYILHRLILQNRAPYPTRNSRFFESWEYVRYLAHRGGQLPHYLETPPILERVCIESAEDSLAFWRDPAWQGVEVLPDFPNP